MKQTPARSTARQAHGAAPGPLCNGTGGEEVGNLPTSRPERHLGDGVARALRWLEGLLAVLVAAVVVAGCLVGAWAFHHRLALYESAIRRVETEVQAATGLPTHIGGLGGKWWQKWWESAELRDIRVYGRKGANAPIVMYLPRVRAQYRILDILKLAGHPVRIDIDDPLLVLQRDARGRLNLEPRFKKNDQRRPKLPAFRFVVHNAALTWEDAFAATSSQVVPFRRQLQDVSIDSTLANDQLQYQVKGRDGETVLEIAGRHDLATAKGLVRARLSSLPLKDWASYLASSEDYQITAGAADLVLSLAYGSDSPGGLDLKGRTWLSGVSLQHKDLLVPLERLSGTVSFTKDQVKIESLGGSVQGNAFTARGQVTLPPKGHGVVDPQLALDIGVPHVALASLGALVPELIPYGPSGEASAIVKVTGGALDPYVDVDAKVAHAVILKEAIGPGRAKVKEHHFKISVNQVQAEVQGGTASGSMWFTTDDHPEVGAAFSFSGVDVDRLTRPLLRQRLPLAGIASGRVVVKGPADDVDVSGNARLAGAFGRAPVEDGMLRFRVRRGNISFSDLILRVAGGGSVKGFGGWDGGGDLALDLKADHFDLGLLRKAGLPVDVTGLATAKLNLYGNLEQLDTLEASGTVEAAGGTAYGQPIDDLKGTVQLANGIVTLRDVLGHFAGATVQGGGTIAPISLDHPLPPPDMHLAAQVENADLSQVAILARASGRSLGGATGRVERADLHLDLVGGKLSLAGQVAASALDAPRIGSLRSAKGRFSWQDDRLSTPGLELVLGPAGLKRRDTGGPPGATSSAAVTVSGSLGLSADPALDLHVSAHRADVRALLGAVHWPRLLEGTWIGARLQEQASQKQLKAYAELPDREGVTVSPKLPLNLSAIYNHWLGAKREPLPANEIFLITRFPFWRSVDGTADAEVEIGGTLSEPSGKVDLSVSDAKAYGHPLTGAVLSASYQRGTLEVPRCEVQASSGGDLRVQGELGGASQLVATVDDLDLSWFNPWLVAQDLLLSGRVGGRATLSGSLTHPAMSVSAEARRGSINQFEYDQVKAQATLREGILSIAQAAIVKDGKTATIAGSLPIGRRPEISPLDLALDIEGDSLGIISVLTKGQIAWRGGEGRLKVNILGTEADPRLAGVLELRGARLSVKSLIDPLTDVDAKVFIGDGILRVVRAAAHYGGGRISADGFITMDRLQLDAYNLKVLARSINVKLANGVYDGQAEAFLDVGGKFKRPSITGRVSVSQGTLNLGSAAQPVPPSDDETPIDLSALNLIVKDSVRVFQPNLMNVRIAGNLIVNGTVAKPQPIGVIKVIPGGTITTLYTNEFKVTEGSVEFLGTGPAPSEEDPFAELTESPNPAGDAAQLPNARVYVVATGTVTDLEGLHTSYKNASGKTKGDQVKIIATVSGSLSDLHYSFQSDPPDYTKEEIATLLGKPSLVTDVLGVSQVGGSATGSVLPTLQPQEIARTVAPGLLNFFVKRLFTDTIYQWTSPYLSDLSLDVLNSQAGGLDKPQSALSGYDLAFSVETVPFSALPTVKNLPLVGTMPMTVSYRHTFRSNAGSADLNRWGLNYRLPFTPVLFRVPLSVSLSGVAETNDGTMPSVAQDITGLKIPGTSWGLNFPSRAELTPDKLPIVMSAQIRLQGKF